MIGILFFLI